MVWVDVEIIAGPSHLAGKSASIQLKETNSSRWDRDIGRVEILRMFGEFDDLRRISRSHFSISYNIEDAMIVRDAGSSNGTKMLDGVYDGPGPINIELSGFLHLRLCFSNQEYSNAVDGIVADTRTSASGVVVPKQLTDREFFDYITSEVVILCDALGLTYQIGRSRPKGWQFGGMGGLLHSDPFEDFANPKIDNTVWKISLDDEHITGWARAPLPHRFQVWEKRKPNLETKIGLQRDRLTEWEFEGDYYLLAFRDGQLVLQHSGYFAGNFDDIFFTSHYTMFGIGAPRIQNSRELIFDMGGGITLEAWLARQIMRFPPNIFRMT